MADPVIHNRLLKPEEIKLVTSAVLHRRWPEASVRRFERFGNSGAQILVLERHDVRGVPQILKIAGKKKILEEYEGATLARDYVESVPHVDHICPESEVQGVLYELIVSKNTNDGVEDLNDVYKYCLNSDRPVSTQKVSRHLRSALSRFERAHVPIKANGISRTYGEVFGRYLRDNRTSRIDQLFDNNPDGLKLHGVNIPDNPLDNYQTKLKIDNVNNFLVNFVHGDLHPSNIVLSTNTGLNLIDFAWAHANGHLFIDYVMLESSMRFKEFPRDINPQRVLAIDAELNRTLLGDALTIASEEPGTIAKQKLMVMTECVMTVRKKLDKVLKENYRGTTGTEIDTEYQRAMYLVLAGQQKFDTFPLMRTTLNLHLLRRELGL